MAGRPCGGARVRAAALLALLAARGAGGEGAAAQRGATPGGHGLAETWEVELWRDSRSWHAAGAAAGVIFTLVCCGCCAFCSCFMGCAYTCVHARGDDFAVELSACPPDELAAQEGGYQLVSMLEETYEEKQVEEGASGLQGTREEQGARKMKRLLSGEIVWQMVLQPVLVVLFCAVVDSVANVGRLPRWARLLVAVAPQFPVAIAVARACWLEKRSVRAARLQPGDAQKTFLSMAKERPKDALLSKAEPADSVTDWVALSTVFYMEFRSPDAAKFHRRLLLAWSGDLLYLPRVLFKCIGLTGAMSLALVVANLVQALVALGFDFQTEASGTWCRKSDSELASARADLVGLGFLAARLQDGPTNGFRGVWLAPQPVVVGENEARWGDWGSTSPCSVTAEGRLRLESPEGQAGGAPCEGELAAEGAEIRWQSGAVWVRERDADPSEQLAVARADAAKIISRAVYEGAPQLILQGTAAMVSGSLEPELLLSMALSGGLMAKKGVDLRRIGLSIPSLDGDMYFSCATLIFGVVLLITATWGVGRVLIARAACGTPHIWGATTGCVADA